MSPRAPASWVLLLTLELASGCSKRSGSESPAPSPDAGSCEVLGERRLGDAVALAAGLTSRRLSDGRLAIGVGLRGEPRAVVVDARGEISVQTPRRRGAGAGELLRVTPALQGGEVVLLTDVRTADGHVDCAAAESNGLDACQSFASADGATTWLVGVKHERAGTPYRLVIRPDSGGPERDLFSSDKDPFEDLRSEHLGEKGFAVSARYGGRVVLLRLKPDFELIEARSYGAGFGENPELVSSGSGALLLTTRKAFGKQRLVFAQFEDQHGRLPVDFSGSDHGLPALSPRLTTAGSQRYLTSLSGSPGDLELVPVGPAFDASGPAQRVNDPGAKVVAAAPVGFDDGRIAVVFVTEAKDLSARTLRCTLGRK